MNEMVCKKIAAQLTHVHVDIAMVTWDTQILLWSKVGV